MLTKPRLNDEEISACLRDEYGLGVTKISSLPIGADLNTSVYRIKAHNGVDYFFKLRREFIEASASIPQYLANLGIKQVIPPLTTKNGQLWANLGTLTAILYPYIEGHNGLQVTLSNQHWHQFGAAIKKLHSLDVPSNIKNGIPQEKFSPIWRNMVKELLERIENEVFIDSVAVKTAEFLKSQCADILNMVKKTEELALVLERQPQKYVLCHADIHGWNLLIDNEAALYIVDWDTLIFARKERDLMFVGAGIWDSGHTPAEEERLFYQGYGQTKINQDAICYYRLERIIQDIGEHYQHIFLSGESSDNRMQSFEYLQANFRPGGTVERVGL